MPGYEIIDKKEFLAVKKIFDEGGVLFAHGFDNLRKKYYVREFEKKNAKFFKSKHTLALTSGTAAIKVALKSIGIKPGDEVITQAFNFIATVEAILDVGAKPIIVNVDENLNIKVSEIKKKITKKTKAIIPVHMLGLSCEMNEIKKICKKKNIKIIEDNCESVGAKFNKAYLGTIGDIGIFSFDHGKILTTGEGGLILTNNKKLYLNAKEYHDHGHKNVKNKPRGKDEVKSPGFNYRMTELQGAIGTAQLKKLPLILRENKKRYEVFKSVLSNKVKFREHLSNTTPNYDTIIFYEKNKNKINKILKIIKDNKFSTKNLPDAIMWHCSSYWPHIFKKKEIIKMKPTLKILKNSIAIPILLKKNLKDYNRLAENILKVYL
jgi:8-amino-3,8-dideoxy-alpha-D-manno-octulosonate transaminase